uniref:Uncharacterized protein n=1 Tax=Physcomitrium patens TaxID=3218 RepID=A0A2K1KWT3_PHYPA|nr:hypothetical protein PHYPA_005201 [Physcomitrium patens]
MWVLAATDRWQCCVGVWVEHATSINRVVYFVCLDREQSGAGNQVKARKGKVYGHEMRGRVVERGKGFDFM